MQINSSTSWDWKGGKAETLARVELCCKTRFGFVVWQSCDIPAAMEPVLLCQS